MMTRKKVIRCTVIVILLVFLGWWINPTMRVRTEGDIRQSLIKKTPLGSKAGQVVNDLRKKESRESIMLLQRPGYYHASQGYTRAVGNKSIGPLKIGSYWTSIPGLPMITYVFATWIFDENDRLIDVLVHKEVDSL